MCRGPTSRGPPRLLSSLESFDSKDGSPPHFASFCLTGAAVIGMLCASEQLFRQIFLRCTDWLPVLENETNRAILARHVGVDSFSCFLIAYLGWKNYDICAGVLRDVLTGKGMPKAAHDKRLYTYEPAGFRISLVFFFYQVKNLYDTILWNDGPEYIFHHVFSLLTAWGAMYPSSGHFYSIFFFGLCEVSTAILCLLANFDDEHGVPGLGDALPVAKLVLGGLFIVSFIVCRCILWPIFSYYFCRDVLQALKNKDDPRLQGRRGWLKFFLVSLSGLSLLQVAWLGEILRVAHTEVSQILASM